MTITPSSDAPAASLPDLTPLRAFVQAVTAAIDSQPEEAALLPQVRQHLATLVAHDGWLPEALAQPHPQYYQQYLLYVDPQQRFSVVSFVWGPGQRTPIHDHTVWGAIGLLRGEEVAQAYRTAVGGGALVADGPPQRLRPGQVELVSPTIGDVHQVSNAFDDRVSISIHVYGANIGAVNRWVYAADGSRKPFVSGYSNRWVPDLWTLPR